MTTTTIVGLLDLADSIGTMLECIQDGTVEGALGDYMYAWKNGQQILIGSSPKEDALPEESSIEMTAFVFLSKDDGRQHRRKTTWNDLRASLAEGWVVGTERKPGVKAWYPKTGRSIRRQMQDIYVFREPRTVAGGDSIHIGSISNNTGAVAVGRGARATVINQIVHGLGHLQTRHEASVRNFLDYYVGSSNSPEPFGGREPDLAAYIRWLDDPAAPPYALLTAPAGMGKSAVLAHWVLQIEQRRDVAVVFFPISERFETNSKSVVFSALFARLAFLHGDPPTRLFSAEEYRGAFQDYLTRPLPDGRRLLVVLDGLDEASGWEVGAGIFPTKAPSHLKVIVAAREIAGDLDWAARLSWSVPTEAVVFGLEGLSRADLEEVLLRMGDPLAGLQANFDLVDKLYELTDHGDPLMIRLYVDALRKDQDSVSDFQPENLQRLKPGLGRFFEFWFAQQENLWRASGDLIDRRAVDTLIHARAMSYGPLTADDLDALNHDIFQGTSGVRRVANALRRFLVGTGARGSGYSFSHPRLTQHFREQLSDRERKDWEERYLAFGAATLAALEEGGLMPQEASEYVVRHYRLHLEILASARARLGGLMCHGWLRAWQELEITEEGFLNDVLAAMEYGKNAGPEWLGQVIRGALCFSSVRSRGSTFDPDLLAIAILTGSLNQHVGLFLIRNHDDTYGRVKALLALANGLDNLERSNLLYEALHATRRIENSWQHVEALCLVADQLPAIETREVLAEALVAARKIDMNYWQRAHGLCTVAERMPPDLARDLIAEALAPVHRITYEMDRAIALYAVVRHLRFGLTQELLDEALAVVRGISPKESLRDSVLSAMAEHFPADEALMVAREIDDGAQRAETLCAVAQRLPAEEAREVLAEALAVAREIDRKHQRVNALSVVAKQLPAEEAREVLAEALSMAREIDRKHQRVNALSVVAKQLPAGEAREVLTEALSVARKIDDKDEQVGALIAMAEWLPVEEAQEVRGYALNVARGIDPEGRRAEVLIKMAEWLSGQEAQDVLAEALTDARAQFRNWYQAAILCTLIPHLSAKEAREALNEALMVAREIDDGAQRAETLYAVAQRLPVEEARGVLNEALAAAREIDDRWGRAEMLCAVAERLPVEEARDVLNEALAAAREIDDGWGRAEMLCAVAKRLPVEEARGVLNEALAVAREIDDGWGRVGALCVVAQRLPLEEAPGVLAEAQATALGINDKRQRAKALIILAERLPKDDVGRILSEALASVYVLGDRQYLRFLAQQKGNWPQLASCARLSERDLLIHALSSSCRVTRREMLRSLADLAPVISKVGGEKASHEVVHAIRDTAEWWP